MIWERLRATERFSFVNQSRIVHVVMDQVIDLQRVRTDQWYHELTQTDTGIKRIKLWSSQFGHLDDEDLLISADVDEVMSASALQALKWCDTHEVRAGSVAEWSTLIGPDPSRYCALIGGTWNLTMP